MRKTVTNQPPVPIDIISHADVGVSNIVGVTHSKFNAENKPKKYKAHQQHDTGEIELIGFLNATGHLHESEKFESMQAVYDYCNEKGHTMHVFDTPQEFGAWLSE